MDIHIHVLSEVYSMRFNCEIPYTNLTNSVQNYTNAPSAHVDSTDISKFIINTLIAGTLT